MQRAELLTGARARLRAALRDERGTALLMGLTIVMVMTLLGVALFEMSTIEASLARGDAADIQAFYCAEAEAARVYALYGPGSDPEASLGSQAFAPTTLVLPSGTYVSRAVTAVNPTSGAVTVTATCTMPDGRTRTVQRNATREYLNSMLQFALAATGSDGQSATPGTVGDLVLGGDGSPIVVGGPGVGGADTIAGDIFVAGNVSLRGQGTVTGYGSTDPPAITVAPGKNVTSTSARFDPLAAGATGQGTISPLPVMSGSQGIMDQIRAAVTDGNGAQKMTGNLGGAPVYNLSEIFRRLGATSEGNRERNLARPSGCAFGVKSADVNCQVWQDLVILGPRQLCGSAGCPSDFVGPTDLPSYFFMGLPRSPSVAPQGTPFSTIYSAAVSGSQELRQLGFTTQYSSLGGRLDAILGTNPTGEGLIERLVDLTVSVDARAGTVTERPPSIFYVDGYWRTDGATSGFAYNGRGTIAATKSVILSDSVLYLGNMANTNKSTPSTGCPSGGTDRASCGAADMLGIMAQENIWMGDPNGRIQQVDAVMLAGRDVNLVEYAASAATCCDGQTNPLTFNGTMLALRGTALARDWADPTPGREGQTCNTAQPPCRPVTFVASDASCGVTGCWRYLSKDPATGLFQIDTAVGAFQGCVTTQAQPLQPTTCPTGSRRVTHFQLTINYDTRLQTNPELIPPGLPTGGRTVYSGLAGLWRDCGGDPTCKP